MPPIQVKFIEDVVANNKIVIFSKTFCPYCQKVKELFSSLNEPVEIIEIDIRDDGQAIQEELEKLTHQKTVPNVFINGKHIGGNDKLQALHKNGQLLPLLQVATSSSNGEIPTIIPDYEKFIKEIVAQNKAVIFSKTWCPYCSDAKTTLASFGHVTVVEMDTRSDEDTMQNMLLKLTGQRTVPNIFLHGKHVGGNDKIQELNKSGMLKIILERTASVDDNVDALDSYDYDLIVIGGGSGGLAASKEAVNLDPSLKVAVLDFVVPTPLGTSWGLGGTCVNVGCIPKKLMHQAALLRHSIDDSRQFGWTFDTQISHNWATMVQGIQDHIGSLNWGYKTQLREKKIDYLNAYGTFEGPHKIKVTDKSKKERFLTARRFIIATGERPKYLGLPNEKEYCITSDDLFSLKYPPGKTLCIGASYVSLECAGFLAALGFDVTVMVRSILLRGFDQQCAELIGFYMSKHGVKFIRPCVPVAIEKLQDGKPGLYRVTGKMDDGTEVVEEYNTILAAVGRSPCTDQIGLDVINVKRNKDGKILANDAEQTSVPYVYAIGDVLAGKPELTPVAIQAGKLLAGRLYGGKNVLTDYINIPTTVFTPLEYGAIGYPEEKAIEKFGADDIEVYHSGFVPLEWTVAHRETDACYAKLVCVKSQNNRVVGFHVCGPNAGEITQGYAVGMRMGATKADFDMTIGIHPTCSETFTTLAITKNSGENAAASGC